MIGSTCTGRLGLGLGLCRALPLVISDAGLGCRVPLPPPLFIVEDLKRPRNVFEATLGLALKALVAIRVTHVFVHKSEVSERRVDVTEFMDWCLACGCDPEEMFHQLRRHRSV